MEPTTFFRHVRSVVAVQNIRQHDLKPGSIRSFPYCLKARYFENIHDRRCKHHTKEYLSSASVNFMSLRLEHFKMAASFESKEEAETFALNFKFLVETILTPLCELNDWSETKAAFEATALQQSSPHESHGIFTMLISILALFKGY